ncbi:MAG: DNA repair protein RecO [Endomicrobiaceae bacterium]|nr:DNA repair protein RecO [Endomicrobiaceae bacterium]
MYYNLNALILNSTVSAEADKTITIYTCKWGKIRAVVPSAKKIIAKLASATEPVTESEITIYQTSSHSKPTVTGARILNNNTIVKQDYNRYFLALYVSELSDKFAPINMPNEKKYDLISRTWQLLGSSQVPLRVLTAFSLRLLKISGYSMTDYIARESAMKKNDFVYLQKISNCSGDELEILEGFDKKRDELMWNYVENYIKTYVPQLSVGTFLKKIKFIN